VSTLSQCSQTIGNDGLKAEPKVFQLSGMLAAGGVGKCTGRDRVAWRRRFVRIVRVRTNTHTQIAETKRSFALNTDAPTVNP
jgi:hypothetical protein